MIKASVFIVASVGLISAVSALKLDGSSERNAEQQENSAPVIKIISPENNRTIAPGAPVRFEITVSDKEDGESKYDEINTKEVLLQVKYRSDSSGLSDVVKESTVKDPPGLAAMRSSNCFNCHDFNTRSIGPSFTEIRKRYQPTAENMASLERRVREGSTGVWGEATMPTHAELTNDQIHNMIKWIIENASSNDVHYYVGTKGSFQVPGALKSGALLLTASYTDHGVDNGDARLQGRDLVVIRIK